MSLTSDDLRAAYDKFERLRQPEPGFRGDFNLSDELVVNRRAKEFLTDDQFEAVGRFCDHGVEVFGDFRVRVCDYVPDGFIVGLRGNKVVAMWGPFKTGEEK